eukprot:366400-Chlamydomonas_euryale.AAC.2
MAFGDTPLRRDHVITMGMSTDTMAAFSVGCPGERPLNVHRVMDTAALQAHIVLVTWQLE